MPFVLPVSRVPQDTPDATAEQWEQAAPTNDKGPQLHHGGGSVAMYRTGPGDIPEPRDEWLGIDLRDLPHEGVENGRQLFVEIPGPPPEGHGGYDIPDHDYVTDRSTQHQALFWSDWYGSGSGAQMMRGEHVVIARVPPGSVQGYMPTDPGMVQANNARNAPTPWDSDIVIGQGQGAAVSL